MKEFLTRKYFGGRVPAWAIIAGVVVIAVVLRTRKKAKATDNTNPAASASEDSTTPFPYSAPDMFPLQGPSGPAGPPGPAGPRGKPGKNAPGIKPTGKKKPPKHRPPPKPPERHVGNRPAYNKRIGTRTSVLSGAIRRNEARY